MPSDTLAVRQLRRDEVGLLREWAAAEGWNPGLYDGPCFHDTDPAGFLLGELAGEPVACISCVAYDEAFGFIGHYIARPTFRGRGYGIQVWRAAMSYLGERNVGLDGVVAQQDNYRKSGFRFAYNNIRYQARGGGVVPDGLVAAGDVAFPDLLAYDSAHFPAGREQFLRAWVALPGSTALACLRAGRLVGYGVVRPVVAGFKIGPLFADDPCSAGLLFRGLLAHAPGAPVLIDCPDETANPHAAELVRRHGLPEVFRTARMYTKAAPPLPLDQVYGVTSLELG